MHRLAALLSVFLAGPALAAPPLSPTTPALSPEADNAALLTAISDGDPELTATPSPVTRVIEAAELAEDRLATAIDLDDVAELLTLAGMGREVAYRRTGAAEHLCALVAAADSVLQRPELPTSLAAEASDFRDRAQAALAAQHPAETCGTQDAHAAPPPSPPPSLPTVARPEPPAGAVHAKPSRLTIAGGVLSGVAVMAAGALVGVQAHRTRAARTLDGLLADIMSSGGKTPAQAKELDDLRGVERRTAAATVGLAVSLGVVSALGLGLLFAGSRRPDRDQRARLSPHAGPHRAGLVISGRF